MRDEVNRPQHYQFDGFQAIDVIEGVGAGISDPVAAILTSHALKYLIRWPRKHGARDLRKARWYLDRLIARMDISQSQGEADAPPPDEATAPEYALGALVGKLIPPHPAGIGDVPVCDLTPQQRMECVLNWGFVPGDVPGSYPGDLDELRAERSGKPWNAEVIAHGSGAGDYGDPIAPRGTP